MQHEIQVRPGESFEKSRHHKDRPKLSWLVMVIIAVRNVLCWVMCRIRFDVNEHVFEESEYLPLKNGSMTEGHGKLQGRVDDRICDIGFGEAFDEMI